MDNRSDIRDFLATRRARLSPGDVGLPPGGRRRVPGLRREEVAVLAGVSTDWYARLEKGHINGVSDDVLDAVARALHLDDEERTYLFDLARAAAPAGRSTRVRRKATEVAPGVQWLLDSMTLSAAFVTNGRLDIVASNPLGRALYAPMFARADAGPAGTPSLARYHFLAADARDFFVDWDTAADMTAALLRAEAGRYPHDKALRELVGELSTVSPEFRTRWAAHNVRIHHGGTKRVRHPDVGPIDLTYHTLDLSTAAQAKQTLTTYTAEPGSTSEDRLRLLASWTATVPERGPAATER